MVITIDGPAGSGKSTASRRLAAALGLAYLDTGATYRGLAYYALELGADLEDEAALADLAGKIDLQLIPDDNGVRVLISGKDVSAAIRTEQITALTRHAAGSALVRGVLVQLQRKIGRELGGFVTEGRDQGSVVFPDADVKFYLDASAEIRARRRTDELQSAGADADYDDILQSIIDRDQRDIARQVGPLVRPDGAIVIDTSDMDINQVTDAMIQAVEERT
ncbi:MAG: (d)CMP kinase [Phycisphaerae bacterium]|nr:(d)CMP kinase [Phycisphaerae bacterium]